MRALVLAAVLIAAGPAQAAEIEALITTAMKAVIDEFVPSFERDTGHAVRVSYGPSGGIARRFIGGEPADAIVIDSGALDDLIRQGKVLPDPTGIARTGIGICVRKGAPKPDVSTPEAPNAPCWPQSPSLTPLLRAAASRPPISQTCSSASASPRRSHPK